MTMDTEVYWVFDDSCHDVKTTGYVGVSKDAAQRFKAHIRKGRVPTHAQYIVLFVGTRDACFELEKLLRSRPGIGWNRAVGGAQGWRVGFTHDGKALGKMQEAWTDERRASASIQKAARNIQLTGQKRPKQSLAMMGDKNPMFGTKRPQHVRDAMMHALKGKPSKNRQELYCVGCHERASWSVLNKYHVKCFKMFVLQTGELGS